jgi:hypothetical protein
VEVAARRAVDDVRRGGVVGAARLAVALVPRDLAGVPAGVRLSTGRADSLAHFI